MKAGGDPKASGRPLCYGKRQKTKGEKEGQSTGFADAC